MAEKSTCSLEPSDIIVAIGRHSSFSVIYFPGARSEEAPEALQRSKPLDAGQALGQICE